MKDKAYIYKITNIINGKVYVGSSNNYEKRIKKHKYELINNKHANKHLQNSWIIHGEENFTFELIKECKLEKQFEVEGKEIEKYIKKLGDNKLYNIIKNPVQHMENMRIKNLLNQGFIVCQECGEIFKLSEEDEKYLEFLSDNGLDIKENICLGCNVDEFNERNLQMRQLFLEELDEFYSEEGMSEYTEAHLPLSLIEDMIESGYYED